MNTEDWTPPHGILRPDAVYMPHQDFADFIDPMHEQTQNFIWLIRSVVTEAKYRAARWQPNRTPVGWGIQPRRRPPYPLAKRPQYRNGGVR